jgi:hypothetical protein
MGSKSEIIVPAVLQPETESVEVETGSGTRNLIEIAVIFGLLMAAIWTPQGQLNSFFSISAAACVVAFAIAGSWNWHELGLTRPLAGSGTILFAGAALCGVILLLGVGLRFAGAGYPIPWSRSWEYAIWALIQEFILQSIFFVRLESMFGGRKASVYCASLFAVAHIPNPVLTSLAFVGGWIFCELFRRYRNLFPIGVIHAALGITIAASFPESWLHHMRVGIGYLTLH